MMKAMTDPLLDIGTASVTALLSLLLTKLPPSCPSLSSLQATLRETLPRHLASPHSSLLPTAVAVVELYCGHPALLPHNAEDAAALAVTMLGLLALLPLPEGVLPEDLATRQVEVERVVRLLPLLWELHPVVLNSVVAELQWLLVQPRPSFALAGAVVVLPWHQSPRLLGETARHQYTLLTVLAGWLTSWQSEHLPSLFLHLVDCLLKEARFSLLIRLSANLVDNLLVSLMAPLYRPQLELVLLALVYGAQSSQRVFSRLAASLPLVLESLQLEGGAALQLREKLLEAAAYHRTLFPGLVLGPDLLALLPPLTDVSTIRWQELASRAWPGIGQQTAVGLVNLGFTCFFNSVIQALYHTPSFRRQVLRSLPQSLASRPLLSSLHHLFSCLQGNNTAATLSPSNFLSLSRPAWFVEGEQQDCSEFLTALLSGLQEEGGEQPGPGGDCGAGTWCPVRQVFGGRMETRHECLACRAVSRHTDWFTDLHLPVTEVLEAALVLPSLAHLPHITVSWTPPSQTPSLDQLLAASLASETLAGENQYQCDNCGGLRDASKTVTIVTAPTVLVLVLLRFEYDSESQVRRKLSTVVEYPDELYVEAEEGMVGYSLQTVVVHSGEDSQEGHYFTWARQQDGRWLVLNDVLVTEQSWQEFLEAPEQQRRKTPYLLLYTRQEATVSPSPGV